MSSFSDREKAFEEAFAHDEALKFKAYARRNKLLGLWAAEKLGLTGAAAEDYARTVIRSDIEEAGEEDVYRKISADLNEKGVVQSEHQIRRTMSELLATAIQQVQTEG
ncbi:DUF1476 domain-containing protein [Chthonobacter albigriseus]|uniref:DUF1476 domain-containing protein n=1 Tax=Chthonobacter albigriseus TaxID=1683161 RepID=UPI0015EE7A7B|nr:DUF1476 domain-containing protein [Chthonobacter albigriseus]